MNFYCLRFLLNIILLNNQVMIDFQSIENIFNRNLMIHLKVIN